MIELKNLTFKYKAKNSYNVTALNDFSFTFKNNGLYFINGKSGCGKSTLLNILSGIDRIQDGDMIIDNKSVHDFKDSDYDNYRNYYAGVIFQEFNLIDTMTVYENIDLPLRLQGKNDNKDIIAECLKKVDLEGYENRYPNELSGGQRQRISIARQLAKGSKVIVADEPTGSLDSENSKNVFEVLKKLSKDTLVIVASHDLESSMNYADEVITVVDGKVVDHKILNEIIENKEEYVISNKGHGFPFLYALKFAWKDIIHAKIRFIVATLLCLISLALVGLFVSFVTFNPEVSIAKTLLNNNETNYSVFAANYYDNHVEHPLITPTYTKFMPSKFNYLESKYGMEPHINKYYYPVHIDLDYKKYPGYINNAYYISILKSIDDIEEVYDYNLASGYLPLDGTNCYITDYFADLCIKGNIMYYDSKQKLKTLEQNDSIYSLVGGELLLSNMRINVAGIINTDYERYNDIILKHDEDSYEYQKYEYFAEYIYMSLYSNLDFYYSTFDYVDTRTTETVCFNDYKISTDFYKMSSKYNEASSAVLFKDSYIADIKTIKSLKLEKNQIILPYELYNDIFNETKELNEYCTFTSYNELEVYEYPKHIGEKIKLKVYNNRMNEDLIDLGEVEVVGVFVRKEKDYYSSNVPLVDDISFESLLKAIEGCSMVDYRVIRSPFFLQNKLKDMRNNFIVTKTFFSLDIYNFEITNITYIQVFLVVSFLLMIFAIVTFANFMGATIMNRKKDIGIIRAVGGSKNNIFKLFFVEGLVYCVIVSVFGLLFSFAFTLIFNSILIKGLLPGTTIIMFNLMNLLIVPLVSFIVMVLSTFIPVRKISKKPPVEIIRSI